MTEVARCYGGGLRPATLGVHITREIRPKSRLILDALDRGEDPINIVLAEGANSGASRMGQMISVHCVRKYILMP